MRNIGPCLCGDPYCPSCGNPAAAKYADMMEAMIERMDKLDMNYGELEIFEQAGVEAVKHYRKSGDSTPML